MQVEQVVAYLVQEVVAYLVREVMAYLALVGQALEEAQAEGANLCLSCLVSAVPLVHLITCGR